MGAMRHPVLVVLAVASGLVACGGSPPPPVSEPSRTEVAEAPEAPPPTESVPEDDVAPEPSEPGLTVTLEPAGDEAPGTRERDGDDTVITMTLGARTVRARVASYALDTLQNGNGAVMAVSVVPSAGGTLLLTHHNLDHIVDPPRFMFSRWSETWWLPATMQSGDAAVPLETWGAQYLQASAIDGGAFCSSDGEGRVRRLTVVEGTPVAVEDPAPCEPVVAEQPEAVFRREGDRWLAEDEYLDIRSARRLGPSLHVLEVAWSDSAQFEEGEEVPEQRSTRLLWSDPTGVVHWFYLDAHRHCRARTTGGEIRCGARRFSFAEGRLVALTPPPEL